MTEARREPGGGLRLVDASKDFSGVHALRSVSIDVEPGEVVGLVGPNGSGKTTLVNVAAGTVRLSSGRIVVDGRDLTGRPPPRFAAAGVVRTFQGLRLFEGLTALDNVLVGAQRSVRPSLAASWARTPAFRRRERELAGVARAALATVGMDRHSVTQVAALSHGQRRRIELARCVAARPRYLILDEPAAGVDPDQVDALATLLAGQRDAGVGVLLVEHTLALVERLADRVVGLDGGAVVAHGTLADVVAHPALSAVLDRG